MDAMTDIPSRRQDEIAAALRAGRELGPEYDDALAASLVDRIDHTIDERVRHHVAEQLGEVSRSRRGMSGNTARFVLALVILGLSVPLTAMAATLVGGEAVVFLWAGMIIFYVVVARGLSR
ncbi:hypothetical protein BJF83_10530 [Nocardiopsis sp. CNR-923]|uniref:hypothetical protein n=1 Tax=Nocardiopsis sp. CNR-923 TaxID=1904965 RepID=UPI000965CDB0|nr:hypothetical protein [Nocardiopsis sp. CNR-923]OLT29587.1 hypothetical protein BJF83_10530 [Nocardiopsis sp. CNR-923]